MNLFSDIPSENILPHDGEVIYYRNFISQHEADLLFKNILTNISWQNDEVIIFGKRIVTKRKTAWYGDEGFGYTYSKITRHALPWTEELLMIKKELEMKSGFKFNSCLLNLYHSGEEGMAWHSDDEITMSPKNPIASISFGAERKFVFKHKKTKENISINLQHGSLLLMKGATQKHWLHALPKTKKITQPRINLTFRTFVAPL
jgi:alkylated DNA repair dioxygenase AlkB